MSVNPADVRLALQRIGAAVQALLAGSADPLVHEVTTRDLHRLRRAFVGAKLLRSSVTGRGGLGGAVLETGTSTATIGASTPTSEISKKDGNPREKENGKTARVTWLTPACLAYEAAYHEQPSVVTIRRMARTFSQLELAYLRAEVQRRYGNYVAATPIKFYSVEHFADTWPRWTSAQPVDGAPWDEPRPGEDVDAYIRRMATPEHRDRR